MDHVTVMPDRDAIIKAAFAGRDELNAVAYAMTRDWSMAEDVVQEAFVTMVERWADVTDLSGVVIWGKHIVRLKALEALRARKRAPKSLQDEHALKLGDQLAPQLGALLGEAVNDANEQRQALLACLGTLKEEHQHLLRGFYWDRLSTDELAHKFGYTGTNIRTILNRLRSKLDACVRLRLHATR